MDREAGCGSAGAEASDPLGGVGGDPVLGALAAVRAATAELSRARLWSRSDAAARIGVRDGFAAAQALQAAWLGLVADLDSRPEAVPGARAGTVAQTFLRAVLLRTGGQASADVRAAHALLPDADPGAGGMPSLGAAFAAGTVSREHVDVALRTMRKLPRRVLSEPVAAPEQFTPDCAGPDDAGPDGAGSSGPDGTGNSGPDGAASDSPNAEDPDVGDLEPDARTPDNPTPDSPTPDIPTAGDSAADSPSGGDEMSAGGAVDAFFAKHCRSVTPFEAGMLARSLLERLDPDGQDGFNPEAVERRGLTHSTDAGGMVVGKFQLDPVTGAWFSTAIEHFSAPDPTVMEMTEDGGTVPVRDVRLAAQRRADALGMISRLALGSEQAGNAKGGEPPRIVVHAGVDDVLDALRGAHRKPDAGSPDAGAPAAAFPTSEPPSPEPPSPEAFSPEAFSPDPSVSEASVSDSSVPEPCPPEPFSPDPSVCGTSVPDTSVPEPSVSDVPVREPSVPSPPVPSPSVPSPRASEPSVPEPSLPEPSLPEPSVPEPSLPEPSLPETFGPEQIAPETFLSRIGERQPPSGHLGHRGATCEPLGPIGPRLLGRFACDAILQKVLLSTGGAVLDLGRDTRTVSRAQRRALNARDRGCVIPGCSAPPTWCEAHHVTWWRHGGRTDIDGLALTCGRDHTLIHLGIWELVMINGVPWARPPDWIDPLRRLTRNTLHQRADEARALGTQLQLTLPPDPDRGPPIWMLSHTHTQDQPSQPPQAQSHPKQSRPKQSRPDPPHPERPPPPDDVG